MTKDTRTICDVERLSQHIPLSKFKSEIPEIPTRLYGVRLPSIPNKDNTMTEEKFAQVTQEYLTTRPNWLNGMSDEEVAKELRDYRLHLVTVELADRHSVMVDLDYDRPDCGEFVVYAPSGKEMSGSSDRGLWTPDKIEALLDALTTSAT